MTFKDHFSRQAGRYTRFRPRYPQELFQFLASLVTQAGCCLGLRNRKRPGGGRSGRFVFAGRGHGSEAPEQIAQAQQHERVTYLVAAAEHCPLESQFVDLITVAQALHWFDLDRFYDEARRMGAAAGCFGGLELRVVSYFSRSRRVRRALVQRRGWTLLASRTKMDREHYATIPFPFDEIVAPRFAMQNRWNLDDVIGYLGTWSSVERFIQQRGDRSGRSNGRRATPRLGRPAADSRLEWPLYLRVGRIS